MLHKGLSSLFLLLVGLCFEDLTIDDSLSDLERLKKYINSKVEAQRLAQVKIIHDTSVEVGYEQAAAEIFPLFEEILHDPEYVIREQFALELNLLCASFLRPGRAADSSLVGLRYHDFLSILLGNATALIQDEHAEVRQAMCDTLAVMTQYANDEDIQARVLPIALLLVHNQDRGELRVTGVEALNKIAQVLMQLNSSETIALCQQFIVPELKALSEDAVYHVRRAVAGNLAPAIGTAPFVLLPSYRMLAADPIWGIRRACASSLADINQAFPESERPELIPLAEAFMNDPCRWVRDAVLEVLGPFIAKLSPIPDALLASYGASGPSAVDSFAEVAVAAGVPGWDRIKDLAKRLALDNHWEVKAKLARGLGQVGPIIGVSETSRLLAFIRDDRSGDLNWRVRYAIAEQLPALLQLFPMEVAWSILAPLCFNLLDDPVKVVGKIAMKSLGPLIMKFKALEKETSKPTEKEEEEEEDADKYKQICHSLIDRKSKRKYGFDVRQQFVGIVSALEPDIEKEIFLDKFLPSLLELVDDPVSNVRVSLAETLNQPRFLQLYPKVAVAVKVLSKDRDKDVRLAATRQHPI